MNTKEKIAVIESMKKHHPQYSDLCNTIIKHYKEERLGERKVS